MNALVHLHFLASSIGTGDTGGTGASTLPGARASAPEASEFGSFGAELAEALASEAGASGDAERSATSAAPGDPAARPRAAERRRQAGAPRPISEGARAEGEGMVWASPELDRAQVRRRDSTAQWAARTLATAMPELPPREPIPELASEPEAARRAPAEAGGGREGKGPVRSAAVLPRGAASAEELRGEGDPVAPTGKGAQSPSSAPPTQGAPRAERARSETCAAGNPPLPSRPSSLVGSLVRASEHRPEANRPRARPQPTPAASADGPEEPAHSSQSGVPHGALPEGAPPSAALEAQENAEEAPAGPPSSPPSAAAAGAASPRVDWESEPIQFPTPSHRRERAWPERPAAAASRRSQSEEAPAASERAREAAALPTSGTDPSAVKAHPSDTPEIDPPLNGPLTLRQPAPAAGGTRAAPTARDSQAPWSLIEPADVRPGDGSPPATDQAAPRWSDDPRSAHGRPLSSGWHEPHRSGAARGPSDAPRAPRPAGQAVGPGFDAASTRREVHAGRSAEIAADHSGRARRPTAPEIDASAKPSVTGEAPGGFAPAANPGAGAAREDGPRPAQSSGQARGERAHTAERSVLASESRGQSSAALGLNPTRRRVASENGTSLARAGGARSSEHARAERQDERGSSPARESPALEDQAPATPRPDSIRPAAEGAARPDADLGEARGSERPPAGERTDRGHRWSAPDSPASREQVSTILGSDPVHLSAVGTRRTAAEGGAARRAEHARVERAHSGDSSRMPESPAPKGQASTSLGSDRVHRHASSEDQASRAPREFAYGSAERVVSGPHEPRPPAPKPQAPAVLASDGEASPAPQTPAPKPKPSAAPDDVDSLHRRIASDDLGRAAENRATRSSSRARAERTANGDTSPAPQSPDPIAQPSAAPGLEPLSGGSASDDGSRSARRRGLQRGAQGHAERPAPLEASPAPHSSAPRAQPPAAPSPGPILRPASNGDRDRAESRGPRDPGSARPQPQRAERPDPPPSSATSGAAAPTPEDLQAALSAAAIEGGPQPAAARAPASDSAQAEPSSAAGRKPSTTSRQKPVASRAPEGGSPLPNAAGAAAAASPQPTRKDAPASRAPASERAAAPASLRPSRAPADEPRVEEPGRKLRPPSPEVPERRESAPAVPTSAAPLTPLAASPFPSPAAPARASEATPLPAPAAPLAAQAEADPSLHLGLLERAAHLSLDIDGAGDLALHVRVRDGSTEIRAEGPAAQLLKDRVHELSASLASEGLQLGHFDLPREQQRGHADAPERPEPRQAPRASAPASGASEGAAPSGSGVHVRA
jgi:hypothetical protein